MREARRRCTDRIHGEGGESDRRFWDHHYQRMPDLVVIEGPKAGGHLGFSRKQLEEFTPVTYDQEIRGILAEVKKYADKYGKEIPVVVAGGIFTREDMLHAMELGADGVQMGTRFVTTWECDASEAYKQTYLHAKKEDIDDRGQPGRNAGTGDTKPVFGEKRKQARVN